jgi:hypothetical protein
MKFVIFCNFFEFFGLQTVKKRLVHVGPIMSRHRTLARLTLTPSVRRPPLASLSPPSRPDARANAGESGAISPALAGRECCRPLSPSRLPIASRGAVEGPSRLPSSPHCHQPYNSSVADQANGPRVVMNKHESYLRSTVLLLHVVPSWLHISISSRALNNCWH